MRFADNFVVGFQHREEAERFMVELRERFAQFGLELHDGKTRLIEFTSKGGFTVLRRTMRKRWQAKLKEVKAELPRRMHLPVPEVGGYLRSVVLGHVRYYGVPMNYESISAFHWRVGNAARPDLWRGPRVTAVPTPSD